MKLKSIVCSVLLCAFSAVFMSGCDITDFSTESLLRPPKTSGDEAEIEQLIDEAAEKNYTLKYPKNGSYRSAIIMIDLDNDSVDEAVAFYRDGDDTARVHMLVMYSSDEQWKLSSHIVSETSDIDSVDFSDVDGSGTLEIITGCTTYSTNINRLSCYKYSGGKTEEIKSGQDFSSFYCGDFDSDGINEIMLLTLYTTENEANAVMLDYSEKENSLYSKAVVKMDPGVVKYKSVAVSEFDGGVKGVVVDGAFATEEVNTQIIYYSQDMTLLRNPLYNEKKRSITQRSCSVTSLDIDGDSILEIPVVSKLPKAEEQSAENVADKIEWDGFSPEDETLSKKQDMAVNYSFNYAVKIPEKISDGAYTATLENDGRLMTFYEWNKSALGDSLFEIRVFDISDWDMGKDIEGYTLISKDNKYAFAFKNINSESDASLTDDEIKTAFFTFTDQTV